MKTSVLLVLTEKKLFLNSEKAEIFCFLFLFIFSFTLKKQKTKLDHSISSFSERVKRIKGVYKVCVCVCVSFHAGTDTMKHWQQLQYVSSLNLYHNYNKGAGHHYFALVYYYMCRCVCVYHVTPAGPVWALFALQGADGSSWKIPRMLCFSHAHKRRESFCWQELPENILFF